MNAADAAEKAECNDEEFGKKKIKDGGETHFEKLQLSSKIIPLQIRCKAVIRR